MNYIYDILLNFNENYYDFYEWDDKIVHIKKIPIVRLDSEELGIIFNNRVKIKNTNYFNKAETFDKKNNIKNYLLLSNEEFIFAVNMDNEGNIIERSSLLFEDENDILQINNIDKKELSYDVLGTINFSSQTKYEKNICKYVIKELKKLNKEELMYIYYECFNKKSNDIKYIIDELENIIINDYDNNGSKVINVLELITSKNHY